MFGEKIIFYLPMYLQKNKICTVLQPKINEKFKAIFFHLKSIDVDSYVVGS